jgi:hypothetical protein
MRNALAKAQRYRDWAEESVVLAQAAASNEMRARHYAIAQHFHLLAEAELKAASGLQEQAETLRASRAA